MTPDIWLVFAPQDIGDDIVIPSDSRGIARLHAESWASETLEDPIQYWQEDPAEGNSEVGVTGTGRWVIIDKRSVRTEQPKKEEYGFV